MASENAPTNVQDPAKVADATAESAAKGKGKAAATEQPVDSTVEEDDDEDSGDEDVTEVDEEDDDDNMEEIDTNNIVDGGRRTRGRVIDWAKAAQENPADDEDDEDDEDDFEPQGEADGDKMDED
ncbi:histone chaperone domain CHZ-domain-containing protein [Xylaria sp. CBS 124048]|nr:histone chaperone domain CHZ-domain-containing protein [Xylaria sp. CBS 124048]